jgi:hypothetical protein
MTQLNRSCRLSKLRTTLCPGTHNLYTSLSITTTYEENRPAQFLTLSPAKQRLSKRTQLRHSHCHSRARMAIFETNPTSPFPLSPRHQNSDFRNEPNLALPTVTSVPKRRITKRTQPRRSHCHSENRRNEPAELRDSLKRMSGSGVAWALSARAAAWRFNGGTESRRRSARGAQERSASWSNEESDASEVKDVDFASLPLRTRPSLTISKRPG